MSSQKSQNGLDEETYDERDDSRPFFQRKEGEVGIYISVYDAVPDKSNDVGLEHFFLMRTTELLFEELRKMDVVNIRATLDSRRLFQNTYIERFEPGIVMAVGMDTVTALDALWDLHNTNRLTDVIHETLISSDVMTDIGVTKIKLVTKLWEDEYDACKKELQTRPIQVQKIKDRDGDMRMVERLKNYQKVIGDEVSSMRDLEHEIDENRTAFINCINKILPENMDSISSLREFENLTKSKQAQKVFNRNLIDLYLTIIEKWRKLFHQFDLEIVTPLRQIHLVCENEKQRQLKNRITQTIHDEQDILDPDYDLQKVTHQEMSRKVLRRDAPLFFGLFSHVPIGIEKVSDIDILIDDYMREFK